MPILDRDRYFLAALKYFKDQNRGLTVEELRKVAGVQSKRFIQFLLAGERGAGKQTSLRLARFFGFTSDDEMIMFGRRLLEERHPSREMAACSCQCCRERRALENCCPDCSFQEFWESLLLLGQRRPKKLRAIAYWIMAEAEEVRGNRDAEVK